MLEEQISKDYVQAMKDKDKLKSATINFLRAQLKNILIEKKIEKLDDKDVVAVIKKQVKQRQDSIEQYSQGNRQDLVDKETAELKILNDYLPEEMSSDALQSTIEDVIKEVGATSMKEMGVVMKAVLEKVEGQADNKQVSQLVKESLSKL